jgi:mRNA-degrading endonuclease RelE of RelBE toxin-antitoxin system
MSLRVELSDQVLGFVSQLAPQPKKRLRDELHKLAKGKADTKRLEGRLAGYQRLRSGSYRVILRQRTNRGQQVAKCIYAAPRSLVYELFEQALGGNY